jgi:hypothetical protein
MVWQILAQERKKKEWQAVTTDLPSIFSHRYLHYQISNFGFSLSAAKAILSITISKHFKANNVPM